MSFEAQKKKVIRFSDTFFKKQMRVAFYFYFPVGYILGHLGLFGLTKWLPEVSNLLTFVSTSSKSQTT